MQTRAEMVSGSNNSIEQGRKPHLQVTLSHRSVVGDKRDTLALADVTPIS